MSRPRIAVLDASHGDENTRRNFRRELAADLAEFDLTAGAVPDGFDYDGVVVTGSRSSVYWAEDWMLAAEEWTAEAIDRGLPCLGICWGHQFLASVLGGTVQDMGAFELGYNEVEIVGDAPLFEGFDDRALVFTSHGDAVTELPEGAEVLAENEYSNHGFRKGHVFGVQFHPEYDMETAVEVAQGKSDFLPADRIEAVVDDVTEENYASACEAKLLFDNFVRYVERVRAERVAAD